ncbi:hypothetical protein SADUNF_Sadunf14G0077500 [Salix dunnii]|uniref:UspA domain-containing protein n=1 Tax=Salix dunnii TaxID=1413687 RepID=A0A835JIK8_9ROSI|nr:hypothetical protein SADUNF_Sadunf14G0077500 [Salix dunnii]
MANDMGAVKERRNLVAVDESEESMNALSWCLKTFHNPSIIDFPKYSNNIDDCVIEKAKRMCREQFQDVKVDTMIEHGDPRDFFCQIAEKLHVDMLVMGRHGYGVIKSF